MTHNTKLFLSAVLASFSFFMAFNLFQNYLRVNEADYFTAYLTNDLVEKKSEPEPLSSEAPIETERKEPVPAPENCPILAESALLVEIGKNGQEEIIFAKAPEEQLAIASLSKLLTAVIAEEFYKSDYPIKISQLAVNQPEQTGWLKQGDILTVEELLYLTLVESSNDAAFALTEPMGSHGGFVELMNLKAKEVGMANTHFYNATGLGEITTNAATAYDLIKLGKYLLEKPKILNITLQNNLPFYLEGQYHHTLINTNELLEDMPEVIKAGKTGFTDTAGGCLLVISQEQFSRAPYRISVVLNSPDRFGDMRKLLTCASFE